MTERPRSDRYLVDQIMKHAEVISVNVRKGREEFNRDPTTRYAVEHATELLAEAAEMLGRAFKGTNPGVPWDRLRELRRGLAHPYDARGDQVYIEQTWEFARDDAPKIAQKLRRARFPKESEP